MATMKAARIARFGGPEVIQIQDVEVPQPEKGEVLVRVVGAGVNPVDYKIREGEFPNIQQDKLPLTLGREVAGIVSAVGEGVSRFKEGDKVFAMIGADGGYAEYARVNAEHLARVPNDIDLITAAAVPLAAHTAWQALFDHGHMQAGQKVLIHGASGGVGHFAVQFAKAKGATVYATGSEHSVDFIQALGADRAINYKTERFEDVAKEFDLVIDLVGGDTQERSWDVLKAGGIMVSTLGEPKRDNPAAQGKQGSRFMAQPHGEQLTEIAGLITAGKVHVTLAKTFALADAAAAQRYLADEHVQGKVVLKVG